MSAFRPFAFSEAQLDCEGELQVVLSERSGLEAPHTCVSREMGIFLPWPPCKSPKILLRPTRESEAGLQSRDHFFSSGADLPTEGANSPSHWLGPLYLPMDVEKVTPGPLWLVEQLQPSRGELGGLPGCRNATGAFIGR